MIFWDGRERDGKITVIEPTFSGVLLCMGVGIMSIFTLVTVGITLAQRFGPLAVIALVWSVLLVAAWVAHREYKVLKVKQRIGDAL